MGFSAPATCFVLFSTCLLCVAATRQPDVFNEALSDGGIKRLSWPTEYEVSWDFEVPYIKSLQSTGLLNKFTAWHDSDKGRQRLTRNGVETSLELTETNMQYDIYPQMDTLACMAGEIDSGKGPTRQLAEVSAPSDLLSSAPSSSSAGGLNLGLMHKQPSLGFVLPDIRQKRWRLNGTELVDGVLCEHFVWSVQENLGYGDVVGRYDFYLDANQSAPVKLHMWGVNLYTGGHFDEYVVNYYNYKPGPIDGKIWEVPEFCGDDSTQTAGPQIRLEAAKLFPSQHAGDAEYDAFVHAYARRHSSFEEYQGRRDVFYEAKAFVEDWNAQEDVHAVDINHFADWTQAEFEAIMLPNKDVPRPELRVDAAQPEVHVPTLAPHKLPKTVDWRGTGADSPVKDQSACGSCWAFGAIGSLESAYFRATGKQLLMSEQHLMDCSWDYGNSACFGGFQTLAFQWLLENGGVATEEDYPYQGSTNYCNRNATLGPRFKGKFVEVTGGEDDLKEALFTKGPMTVSVDAGPESFRFYSSGIYSNKACHSKLSRLDHAVMVSGYGTTDDGKDYWIVKNVWSPYWGEKGYIRIARNPQDCGIATQPIYMDIELLP